MDVTEAVSNLVEGIPGELHLSSTTKYPLGYTLWEETAMYPPYPRRFAVRYRYGAEGKVFAIVTEASREETFNVAITPERSEPPTTRSFQDDRDVLEIRRAREADGMLADGAPTKQQPYRQMGMAMQGGAGQKQVASPFGYNHDLACGF